MEENTNTLRQALEKMEHHGYADNGSAFYLRRANILKSTSADLTGMKRSGGLKELNFPSLYQMEEIPCHGAGEPFPWTG